MRTNFARTLGFSIIEILVALLILAGGLLTVAKFQVVLVQTGSESKQRTEAVLLAQQKLESLRSFVQITSCAGCVDYSADIANSSDSVTGRNAVFTRTWTVTSSTNPAYKTIEMKVTWPDLHGVTKTVVLNSQVTNADPASSGNLVLGSAGSTTTTSSTTTTTTTTTTVAATTTTTAGTTSTTTSTAGTTTTTVAASLTISGSIQAGSGSPNMTKPSVTGSAGAACTLSYDGSNVSGYACTVASGWTGTVTGVGGTGNTDATTPASYSFTAIASNQSGKNFIVTK